MRRLAIALLAALSAIPAFAAEPQTAKPQTVEHVDLARYAGHWYELARYPNRFETQCAREVTADYAQRPDGRIDVRNRCIKADGSVDEALGVARVVDAASNARLKVRFAPAWLSWLPVVWGDYWVLDLAPDYGYALVGDSARDYLWLLARTPTLPESTWQHIEARAREQGFDPARLQRTAQTAAP